jgi:hypothetical protein
METVSYSYARAHLAEIWDEVESSREEVVLRRRGHQEPAPSSSLRPLGCGVDGEHPLLPCRPPRQAGSPPARG